MKQAKNGSAFYYFFMNRTYFFRTFLLSILLLLTQVTFAITEIGGIYYSLDGVNHVASVYSGRFVAGDVVIPSVVADEYGTTYRVIKIQSGAFSNNNNIVSVTIPLSITEIGKNAFDECKQLININIPTSIKEIEENTFRGCSSLKKIDLPNTVTSIGWGAFAGSGIRNFIFPSEIAIIGDNVFQNCTNLEEISWPEKITSIGKQTFDNCTNLKLIILPKTITNIEEMAFTNSGITSIEIPEKVKKIKEACFMGCSQLVQIDFNAIDSIDGSAFYGCSSLQKLVFPKSLTYIEGGAFAESGVSEVTFLSTKKLQIGQAAFRKCKNLSKVNFPTSPLEMDLIVFGECSALREVILPASLVACSSAFSGSGLQKVTFQEGSITVPNGAFNRCKNLTEVILPQSVDTIGGAAFLGCTSLREINLPKKLKILRDAAFMYSGLKKIKIPDGVDTLGIQTFQYCTELAEVTLPANLKVIHQECFDSCISLREIHLPEKTEYLGWGCFNSTKLSYIKLPSSVNKVSECLFRNCSDLQYIDVDSENENFASKDGILYNKDFSELIEASGTIVECIIPSTVVTIGHNALWGRKLLKRIVMPMNIKSIGGGVFKDCENLLEIYCYAANPPKTNSTRDWAIGSKYILVSSFDDAPTSSCTLYVPSNVLASYQKNDEWSKWRNVEPIDVVVFDNIQYELDNTNKEATLLYSDKDENVEIPKTIKKNETIYWVTRVHAGCFEGNKNIKSVKIPTTVSELGKGCFSGCSALNLLVFYNDEKSNMLARSVDSQKASLKIIEDYCFEGCSSLTALELPSSTEYIGISAFSGCSSLSMLKCNAETPPTTCADDFGNTSFKGAPTDLCKVVVPEKSIEAYRQNSEWSKWISLSDIGAGISDVYFENGIHVTASQGRLLISGARDNDIVNVYTMDGRNVVKTTDKVISHLTSGIYIVSIRNQRFKIKL